MSRTKHKMAKQPSHVKAIKTLVQELIEKPDEWLDTQNDQLGGAKPRDLLGTPKETVLLDLLNAIKYGMFS